MKKNQANRMEWKKISKKMRNDWLLYLLIVPVVVWYLIFCYLPIAGGLSLSVRNFRFDEGIWNSVINKIEVNSKDEIVFEFKNGNVYSTGDGFI